MGGGFLKTAPLRLSQPAIPQEVEAINRNCDMSRKRREPVVHVFLPRESWVRDRQNDSRQADIFILFCQRDGLAGVRPAVRSITQQQTDLSESISESRRRGSGGMIVVTNPSARDLLRRHGASDKKRSWPIVVTAPLRDTGYRDHRHKKLVLKYV
jgi:vacuolar-type H+-ATPase subunit F/Vma7